MYGPNGKKREGGGKGKKEEREERGERKNGTKTKQEQ